ncbi:MAG: nuclear transport factor 2 family protein [Anaerolineae bacterium]|nr:nuclear transport factor 2 family protein [Anaerolineae bacterium]MCI0609351.1 nuclear transport factor 2 family protein [Anaerolineae bacterium]
MNTKSILFILFVIVAQALAACGTAAPVAEQPTIAPPPAPTATPIPADPAAIAQSFWLAVNEGDIEAAMVLVAEDVKCRGTCYLTGKESFRSLIQGTINSGARTEISDLKVERDMVTYNWTFYNVNGAVTAGGTDAMQIKDGKIILIEGDLK